MSPPLALGVLVLEVCAALVQTETLHLTLSLNHDPYQEAIADYTAALDVEPRNAYAFYNRGITYDRLGDYGHAVDDFTSAIQLGEILLKRCL